MFYPPPLEPSFKQRLSAGFTLVEIAIVLVIIGLIIGGIMVGADMIKVATLRSQISQINRYSAAMATFQLKYGALPGDMPASMATQNGFVSRTGEQGSGDGNGVIEGGHGGGVYYGWNLWRGENALFWDDLSSAALIDQAFSTPASNNLTPNTTAPRGKISGVFISVWSTCYTGGLCFSVGTPGVNYFGLMSLTANPGTTGYPGLTVSQAYDIDSKIDDGTPQLGAVTALYPSTPLASNGPAWATNAGADTSATCFNSTTNAYSININGGAAMNCGVSLKLR